MRYSVLFVLALIFISGFIAYFGDILGRRMGKKRLTLFNLRPRHTAIVVTTITGMLISGLALLALISVNSEFRKVLTEGERIFSQNKRLSTENVDLVRSNRSLRDLRAALLLRVAERQKELDAAREQVKIARKAKEAAAGAVRRLEADVAARKKDLEVVRSRQLVVQTDLDNQTEELARVQAGLASAQADLGVAQKKYADTAASLGEAQASLTQAQGNLAEKQRKLLDVQSQLLATTEELVAKEKERSTEQSKRIQAEALKLHFEQQFRSGNLVLRQNDEIVRGVISADRSPFLIRADLVSLLEKASDIAEKRNVRVGANGRAVLVVFRNRNGSLPEDSNESVWLDNARDTIAQSGTNALVQVLCARNTVAGEQALVEFALYSNNLVFRKGDSIAATRLDGFASEGRVLLTVISFLQGAVADAAVRKGVVPVPNYDPRQSLSGNPQKQLDDLLAVVDQIRSKRTKADVTVYACADIYSAGPLSMDNMRFSVVKVK